MSPLANDRRVFLIFSGDWRNDESKANV